MEEAPQNVFKDSFVLEYLMVLEVRSTLGLILVVQILEVFHHSNGLMHIGITLRF